MTDTTKPERVCADTIAFVQEWMMSGDHEPDQWHKDFAAAIDARSQPPAAPSTANEGTVGEIETVTGDFMAEHGESFYRIELNGYCADFDHREAAENFAAQINALQSRASTANEGEALTPSSVDDSQEIAASVNEGEAVREAIAADREKAAFFAGWDANRTENAARWVESARDRCWRNYRTSVSCNEEDAGMIETPLYAHPPATPDAVTALREALTPSSVDDSQTIAASVNEGEAVERVARALVEQRIRQNRRWDTDAQELEKMLPGAIDHAWREEIGNANAAIAASVKPATPEAVTALRRIADTTSLQEAGPIPVGAEDSAAFLARELIAVRDIARAALTKGEEHVS